MIAQGFNSTAELAVSTVSQTNKANTEIETQPVTVEAKISKCSTLNIYMSFYAVYSLNHCFILSKSFLFHLGFFSV